MPSLDAAFLVNCEQKRGRDCGRVLGSAALKRCVCLCRDNARPTADTKKSCCTIISDGMTQIRRKPLLQMAARGQSTPQAKAARGCAKEDG